MNPRVPRVARGLERETRAELALFPTGHLATHHWPPHMTNDQFRQALQELHGDRDLAVYFGSAEHLVSQANPCIVKRAMLIPSEEDGLVKVTDGKAIYIIDAEKVAWIKIG